MARSIRVGSLALAVALALMARPASAQGGRDATPATRVVPSLPAALFDSLGARVGFLETERITLLTHGGRTPQSREVVALDAQLAALDSLLTESAAAVPTGRGVAAQARLRALDERLAGVLVRQRLARAGLGVDAMTRAAYEEEVRLLQERRAATAASTRPR